MKLFPNDRLYVEAGESAEQCRKLLERTRRFRNQAAIFGFLLTLVAAVACAWQIHDMLGMIRALSHWRLGDPDTALPGGPPFAMMIIGIIFLGLPFDFAIMLHADACVKALLLSQRLRGESTQEPTDRPGS